MTVLALFSIKGGVGKTAAAVNLADVAARRGLRVILWDLDPQGAASFYLRVKPRVKGGIQKILRAKGKRGLERRIRESDFDGLDLMPADFSYRHLDLELDTVGRPRKQLNRLLLSIRRNYDVVVLDCPPSISLASESVFRASDAILSPIIPTTLSLRTFEQLANHLRGTKRAPELVPFFSMVDRRKALHRKIVESAPAEYPAFLKTAIPYASSVEQMGVRRAPIGAFAPRSAPARAYEALWSELSVRIGL